MAITPGSPVAPGERIRLPPRHHAHHGADQRVGAGEMSIVNRDWAPAMRRRLRGAVTVAPPVPPELLVPTPAAAVLVLVATPPLPLLVVDGSTTALPHPAAPKRPARVTVATSKPSVRCPHGRKEIMVSRLSLEPKAPLWLAHEASAPR